MGNLTKFEIDAWIKRDDSEGATAALCDGDNLWLTRNRTAEPTWVLRYRIHGVRKEVTIGYHTAVGGLRGAREQAADYRLRIGRGEDVAKSKRMARLQFQQSHTYSTLLEDYLTVNRPRLASNTLSEIRRIQKLDFVPKIGNLPVADLTPATVASLIRHIGKRSQSVARRGWEQIVMVFRHGVSIGAMTTSPCASLSITSILGARPARKERIKLTVDELRIVLGRLRTESEVNCLAVQMLLYSCVRKSELLNAKWGDFDLIQGRWKVPASSVGNKSRRAYTIPLAPQVISWLHRLQTLSGMSQWVLPAQANRSSGDSKPMSLSTLNVVLGRVTEDIRHISPHDCRSTARSYLSEFEPNQFVIERALNHSLGGLFEVYEKSDYFEERKKMLDQWASFLTNLLGSPCVQLRNTFEVEGKASYASIQSSMAQ